MNCQVPNCNFETQSNRSLSSHLQIAHSLSSKEYTIKYLYENKQPMCLICGEETRYVSFTFKKYCKKHSKYAMSEAGRSGGQACAWNKGLTKETDERIALQAENMMGEKNHFYGKTHPRNLLESLKKQRFLSEEEFNQRLQSRFNDFEFFIDYENYESRQYQFFDVKCKTCGHVEKKTLSYLEKGSRCSKCFPNNISSQAEDEIADFIKNDLNIVDIKKNIRTIISPKELDIFIPSHNFAIEYNGLYWHTEDRIGKKQHLQKTIECQKIGIQLFHVFSDEWKNKKDIVKSMIRHRLKKQKNRVFARKCTLRETDNKSAMNFFEQNHISGPGSGFCKCFGLYFNNQLVSCVAFKKPFEKNNKFVLENARFASKINTVVIGSFSKLLKHSLLWGEQNGYKQIKSFADLRFGFGEVYEKNGFDLIGKTPPQYWYTNKDKRFFRTLIRAKNGLTERENADKLGMKRVYGNGSNICIYDLKKII